jgi:hypothetical protein
LFLSFGCVLSSAINDTFGDFFQLSEELFEPVALNKVVKVRCLNNFFVFTLFDGQTELDMQILPGFWHY